MYNGKWTAHLNKENKEQFQDLLNSNNKVLDRLAQICYNRVNELEKSSVSDYNSPSWAFLQADRIGELRALKHIIELCTPTERTPV